MPVSQAVRGDRRAFLAAAAASLGGFALGCRDDGGDTSATEAAPPLAAEGRALRSHDLLRNESADPSRFVATLVASAGDVALLPGPATSMLRYNQSMPAPLIALREGQRVRITLENRLSQPTTVHWHGLPVPPAQDGNPMDPVAAGATHDYVFDLPEDCAGTYWYHPHPHDLTAAQVARGLAGPLIVRAADDPLAHLPEVSLFITGVKLDAENRIAPDDAIDWTVGRQKERLLVNGGRVPVHSVRPGATERWRIYNATAASYLRLRLDGHTLTLVGTDGGLLEAPIAGLTEFLLAPAQRIEIVVRANAAPNGRYRLRAARFQADFYDLGAYRDEDLLTLATTNDMPAAAVDLPATLRPIADLGPAQAHQLVRFDEVRDLCTRTGASIAFLINGRIFDLNRVDLVSVAGRVEEWDIFNNTAMPHPFHIHGTQFQVVSRRLDGNPIPAPYRAWVDTVLVPVAQTVTIKVRQELPGKRMLHCHILQHEDNCMMAILDVQPAG